MTAKRDCYEVLGVPKTATPEEITRAFRKLARRFHPDVNPGDKGAETKFKEIAEAYEILSDKDKRARYDRFGYAQEPGFQPGFDPRQGGGGAQFEFTGDGADGFGQFEDLFKSFFGGGAPFRRQRGGRGAPLAEDGEDILAEMEIEFMEALKGTNKAFTLQSAAGTRP